MIIKEYDNKVNLKYFNQLSNESIASINSIRNKIKDLTNFIKMNSIILTTINDDSLENSENISIFNKYLKNNKLTKEFLYNDNNYYVRKTYNSINDFLFELEEQEVTYKNVLNAIYNVYLSFSDYYDTLIESEFYPSKLNSFIEEDDLSISNMSLDEIISEYDNAITDFENDINNSISDIKYNLNSIIKAYKKFKLLEV